MPTILPYRAFVTRRRERESGTFFPGGSGAGRFLSTDSTIEGFAAGYSAPYMPLPEPLAVEGRFAGFNQHGHMFRPFMLPVLNGRPINAQYPLVDGPDLGAIRRRVPGGKLGIPNKASVTRGREVPVWMDRTVWARRQPTSLTSRVIR